VNKRKELLALAKKRQATRWGGCTGIGDYHAGVYECDHVSPITKTAGNYNSPIMVVLQDWWSDDGMTNPRPDMHEDCVKLGYGTKEPTITNLIRLLKGTFGLDLSDIYATNVFVFGKPGGKSASIPQALLLRSAREFTLPEILSVNPRLVICRGRDTFNALRKACDLPPCPTLDSVLESPFDIGRTRVWGQAHTATRGQNSRTEVLDDWLRMKVDYQQRLRRDRRNEKRRGI
jgi:hypothetical protein